MPPPKPRATPPGPQGRTDESLRSHPSPPRPLVLSARARPGPCRGAAGRPARADRGDLARRAPRRLSVVRRDRRLLRDRPTVAARDAVARCRSRRATCGRARPPRSSRSPAPVAVARRADASQRVPLGALSGLAVIAVVIGVSTMSSGLFIGATPTDQDNEAARAADSAAPLARSAGPSRVGSRPRRSRPRSPSVPGRSSGWTWAGDGSLAFNAADVDEVCPADLQEGCATLADLAARRLSPGVRSRGDHRHAQRGAGDRRQPRRQRSPADARRRPADPGRPQRGRVRRTGGSAEPPSSDGTRRPRRPSRQRPRSRTSARPRPRRPPARHLPRRSRRPRWPPPRPPIRSSRRSGRDADRQSGSDPGRQPADRKRHRGRRPVRRVLAKTATGSPSPPARPADAGGSDVYLWKVGDDEVQPLTSDGQSSFASWSGDQVVVSRVAGFGDTSGGEPFRST